MVEPSRQFPGVSALQPVRGVDLKDNRKDHNKYTVRYQITNILRVQ